MSVNALSGVTNVPDSLKISHPILIEDQLELRKTLENGNSPSSLYPLTQIVIQK